MKHGWANAIIDKFDKSSDFFDPNIIPTIPKLLDTDFRTLINCMEQLNLSRDGEKLQAIAKREAKAVVEHWKQPGFLKRMAAYKKK